ncbi:hypothetical protein UCRPC4_g02561 [Phaeomoniella chlamydospora]|uniref:DnaJ homologue subfamily C member 28 conserved domain-containing protein n=1 Tax=Phaeomoniella chlamydospora TaxID=158046 RepID=A0A0G2H5W7_PHACM|nr:hypothetical protein UCRPC4_g02561 [Phaeomoniella chlamydospora]
MQDAGFSEDLKKELEEKIARSSFRAQNQQAFSIAETPSYAGAGTRAQAAARPWTGDEAIEDSALRMLDDAHKPLRLPGRAPKVPSNVNLKPAPKPVPGTAGQRIAHARDKMSKYTLSQNLDMTEAEREQMRKELKERFTPSARAMPVSLQGLTSLANERIEDAISRGQFRNIQKGKGVNIERDYNASSPFLDTTEYFMNKIIQKQEIVPPWIEKQQELVKAAQTFRSRLRNEWRRHAARLIASQGGTVSEQVLRAKAYALAEANINPPPVKRESMSQIDSQGNLIGSVIIEQSPSPSESGRESDLTTLEKTSEEIGPSSITITESASHSMSEAKAEAPSDTTVIGVSPVTAPESKATEPYRYSSDSSGSVLPSSAPFRDPAWESLEAAYHNLAIQNLNSLTRSYNLMAPKVAQKPYFSLERELNRCYADVAPELPREIEERAKAPKIKIAIEPHKPGGVMERFSRTEKVRVHDERKEKFFGWKDFWRDLWNPGEAKA